MGCDSVLELIHHPVVVVVVAVVVMVVEAVAVLVMVDFVGIGCCES